ncbi:MULTISPECIES: lipoxygenase family protein [unclassified Microcoleus]|uniref:lipoxygenase family protein n=1 Tax=unclassified Microcoleus TaxID=2642155 RepID=UPI0025F433C3|nr:MULTISPECIES: lipoxygenase family protein [unclassified Microcoleus]
MSFSRQQIIETLYRLVTFLATVPLARRLIVSNKYEYDYTVLAPLAMTEVPLSPIGNLPRLPNADELPSLKWVSLVLSTLSILNEAEKSANLLKSSLSNEGEIDSLESSKSEIDSLESIDREIRAAQGQAELTNAVLKLESVLERKVSPKLKSSTPLTGDFSEAENVFDRIDIEIQTQLNLSIQEESATSLQIEEVEEVDRELYKHLQGIARCLGEELIDRPVEFSEFLLRGTVNPTLEDYEKLLNPLTIRPATVGNFQQDAVFAYMQVAGPNPVMLNQIQELDERLLITSEQYGEILHEDNLEAALQSGRLYLADYSKLDSLVNSDIGGLPKYMYAPIALFAVPPEQYQDRNLRPIAIRCQPVPGDNNPIFTPLDGDNWMTAKTVVQMADSNYHELISHLAQTHLFIEPFVLATNRCFTDNSHPVMVLLKPHLQGTILINYGAHKNLLAPEGPIDLLLSATIGSNGQLAIKEAMSHLANFNEVAFPRTLEKRGVNNSQQLPIYPYRDDGQLIWDAIHQWVGEYLRLHYSSDESVVVDRQLQNWAGELFAKGHCYIGENADGRIASLDYLVEAISTVIFAASAQHAAVNFPQSGLMTYAPAFPLGCYSPAPTNPAQQQNFMGSLPPLERALLQIEVLFLLGSVYYTNLLDYPGSSFVEPQLKRAFEKFKVNLNDIEAKILEADAQRLVSYRFLQPSKIPLSINI